MDGPKAYEYTHFFSIKIIVYNKACGGGGNLEKDGHMFDYTILSN